MLTNLNQIIDVHCHIYPEKIAVKAAKAVGEFYNVEVNEACPSADNLIINGSKAGISKYIVYSVATNPLQVNHINSFIASEVKKHSEFVGFATLHPSMQKEEILSELEQAVNCELRGLKLHPDLQKFNVDAPELDYIYQLCADTNLPIMMHMGDAKSTYSATEKLINTAKRHPKTTFIGAHFGGYLNWNIAEQYIGVKNIFFDTSSSLYFLTPERAKELITSIGIERFMFGSDYPMWSQVEELMRLQKLNLTAEQYRMITCENAVRILHLS